MILNAATRLTAVKADEKQALKFLQELGFSGLKVKDNTEDRISFKFTDFDEAFLNKHLGHSKPIQVGVYWKFGTSGSIVVKPRSKVVVLRNAKTNSTRTAPIVTHAPVPERHAPTVDVTPIIPGQRPVPKPPTPVHTPVPKLPPAQDPNVPGARDNDDSQVPVTHIPENLVTFYKRAQRLDDRTYRLRFMALLWKYLNEAKFGSRLKEPNFKLLKDQAAYRMRVRGRWWAFKRDLEVAPRLFNAHQDFFVEIYLHEMCHQAVSEIDHMDHDPHERQQKGHGPYWQSWMRRVGLNPLRFDPNDNSTYMTEDEKEEHQERKDKHKNALDEIRERGLRTLVSFDRPQLATALWNNELYAGWAACATANNSKSIAFFDTKDMKGTAFKIVPASQVYQFSGTEEERDALQSPEGQKKVQSIISYYRMKSMIRKRKSDMRKGFGF